MTHARQDGQIDAPAVVPRLRQPPTPWAPPAPWPHPSGPVLPPPPLVTAEPVVLYDRRVARGRVLRITRADITYLKQRMAVDTIDEVSYYHEPMFGPWMTVLLLLVLPIGLIALSLRRGRYRCRFRAGRDTIDVIMRPGSTRSARRRVVDAAWAELLGVVHSTVSPVVVDRLADRIFAGDSVRIGRVRFDADGVGSSKGHRLMWGEVGSPDFDGHHFHLTGFDRQGKHCSAGKVAARRPNAVLVPMLTQLGRVRACRPPGAPPVSAALRRESGTMVFGPVVYVGARQWRGLRSVAVVLSVALAVTAVAVRVRYSNAPRDAIADKPAWATTWDPRVTEIASFVERVRALTFTSPVSVQFLSEGEFAEWASAQRSDADGAAVDPTLGPAGGEAPSAQTDLTVAPQVVGVYSPADRTVRVRGQESTPDVRVTLAHELTHALQDQTFDLDALQQQARDHGNAPGLTAVLEGDAVTVEREYFDRVLTPAEQAQVTSSETGAGGLGAQSADASLASAYLPYVFGPQLIATIVATGGDAARNRAMSNPPASDLGVLDPVQFVAGNDTPASVPTPVPPTEWAPDGATAQGTIGALDWYLILSSSVDPRLVARTIEEWDGDSYATYQQGALSCVDAVVHISPLNTADHLVDAFSQWAAANSATVTVAGHDILITTCRPLLEMTDGAVGTGLRVIYARNELVLDAITRGWSAPVAHCMSNRALVELPVSTLVAAPFALPGDWADRLDLYRTTCDG